MLSRIISVMCAVTMVVSLTPIAPSSAYAATGSQDIQAASIVPFADDGSGGSVSGGDTISENGTYTLTDKATGAITVEEEVSATIVGKGSAETFNDLNIVVENNAELTFENVYIKNASFASVVDFRGSGSFAVKGTNCIDLDNGGCYYSVIHVGGGSSNTVTFGGDGILYGYKSACGAFIGANSTASSGTNGPTENDPMGNVVFNSGTWLIKGTKIGAVIGNDKAQTGMGSITINGGELHLKAVARGACLGASAEGYAPDVVINGGLIECYVDGVGAAIGDGAANSGVRTGNTGNVTINGGSLKAVKSPNQASSWGQSYTVPMVTNVVIKSKNNLDSAILAFDTSSLDEGNVAVTIDDGESFSIPSKYRYVVNEVKNPTAATTPGALTDTSSNFLANVIESALQDGVNRGDDGYPNTSGSSFAPDTNLYFALSKASHTLTVNGDTYNVTWDATASKFTYEKVETAVTDTFANSDTRKGDGSEASPYQLSTEADLIAFQEAINADTHPMYGISDTATYTGKYFKLMNDIELTKPWVPVGKSTSLFFAGTFDGDGHTISKVTYSSPENGSVYAGFFGMVRNPVGGGSVYIKNLKIQGAGTDAADISDNSSASTAYVGGLVGYMSGITVSGATGTVYIDKCVTDVSLKGCRNVGGIMGSGSEKVNITDCLVLGNIKMYDKSASTYAGCGAGIIGTYTTSSSNPTFKNNLFLGQINTTAGMASANGSYKDTVNALVGKVYNATAGAGMENFSNNHYVAQTDTAVKAYRSGTTTAIDPIEPAKGVVVTAPTTAVEAAALVSTMGWGADSLMAQSVPKFEASEDDIEATIGEGTSTDTAYPPYGSANYKNSLNEFIFTPAEVGVTGNCAIRSIAFDVASVGPISDATISIYMGVTDKAGFASDSDIVTEGLMQVYSGTMDLGTEVGWEKIEFDDEFVYNGTDNLLVVVVRGGNNYKSSLKYSCTPTEENSYATWIRYTDGLTPWIDLETALNASWPTKSGKTVRPNVRMTIGTPAETFDVAVAEGIKNGTVTVDRLKAAEGKTVTITATPDEGYKLDAITVTDADNNPVEVTDNTFTMPAKAVTVSATFAEKPDHAVTVAESIENGTVAVDKSTAKQGATVTITATPATGFELATVTLTPEGSEATELDGLTFEMPDANVTVSATFRAALDLSPALKAESPLSITSTNSNDWTVQTDGERSFIQSDKDGANVSVTITSGSAGWLVFDWQFSTSGNWQDKFSYTLTGDTLRTDSIGANNSSSVGEWVTQVVAVNAGTTKAEWSYAKGQGSTALLDEVRFVTAQTAVAVTADEHTTATAKAGESDVTVVNPGTAVTFAATPADGYVFSGWKLAQGTEDYANTATSFTQTVYDEPVSYYAASEAMAFEGEGTVESPFLIKTMADLQNLVKYVAAGVSFSSQYLQLANDIDAAQAEFAGIGDSSKSFAGTFDGNDKTISNIKLANGLFNYASNATIKNLSIEDATLAFDKTLMNYAGIVAASFTGTMTGVTTSGTVTTATELGSSYCGLGGLVGNLGSDSTISGCSSSAVIMPTKSHIGNTDPNVGGIVGAATSYSSTIANCAFMGEINGTSGESNVSCVGGIVGKISSSTTVSGCIVAADISGYQRIGGILGSMEASGGDISNCEYCGNVSGTNYVGGIAGYMNASNMAGIQNCLAYGTVTATGNNAGGISGYSYRAGLTSGNIALSQSVKSAGDTAGRITGGTEESTWNGAPTLSGNYAWAGTKVNDAVIADEAPTAVSDGIDGASVANSSLFGEETYAPASTWSADTWTVAAGTKPQLKSTEVIATLSTDEYPEYIEVLRHYGWYKSVTDNAYVISTAEELAEFAQIVNGTVPSAAGIEQDGFAGKTVTLAADIDLSAYADWTPIGTSAAAFAGTLDGAKKSITGLAITSGGGYKGLFGNNAGTVKDFTIDGKVAVTGGVDFVAAVAGFNSGTIQHVQSAVDVSAPSAYNVGGIAGLSTSGIWVNSSDTKQTIDGATGLVSECATTGFVTGGNKVGGIVGENAGKVSKCSSSATVDGTDAFSKNGVGGIVGRNGNNNTAVETGYVDNCYFSGKVGRSGQKWVGGIAGFNNGRYGVSASDPKENSSVTNCVMVGTLVSSGSFCNAIVGNQEGSASNNYALEGYANSGSAEAEIGIAKSADELKADSFVLLLNSGLAEDADDVWNADNSGESALNNGFPVLAWQGGRATISLGGATVTLSTTSYTYDGTEKEPSVSVKLGDFVVDPKHYDIDYGSNVNVGEVTVKVTGKGNYQDSATAKFTIAPATLTVTASSESIGYNDLVSYQPSFTVTGFANGETADVAADYVAPTVSKPASASEAGGTYDLVVSGGSARNYTFAYVNGKLTVGAKPAPEPTPTQVSTPESVASSTPVVGEQVTGADTGTGMTADATVNADGESVTLTNAETTASKVTIDTVTVDGTDVPVTAVAANALKGSKAKSITVGNSVEKLGKGALANTKKLTKLTIGTSVKKVGKDVLKGSKVQKVTLKSSKLSQKDFKNLFKNSKVKTVKLSSVGKKVKKNYQKWAKALEITVK